jgi:signal transduction histidine kinase/ActR/RegA family two-component response regulator
MQKLPSSGFVDTKLGFASGGGEMGAVLRSLDWAVTPLGALDTWPQSLRTAASMMLNARHPMYVAWGPELCLLYNDGYREILGAKALDARQVLGKPFREVWADVWHEVGPMLDATLRGESLWFEDHPFTLVRNGFPEQMYASFATSPIRDESGGIAGVLCVCSETTGKVRSQQERERVEARLRLLDAIGEATRLAAEPKAIMEQSTRLLGEYLDATRVAYADLEPDNDRFTIRHDWRVEGAVSTAGVYSLDLFGSRATSNLRVGRTLLIEDVDRELAPGDGSEMFNRIGIKAIICCPLVKQGRLVAMMAVHQAQPRIWTAEEVALVEAVVDRCWAHIERVRSTEALREADRRKSEFLATLAHELRNPLAPIRNALELLRLGADKPGLLDKVRATMERQVGHMVHLINDLLDIARISSGKVVLKIERVDLQSVVASAVETSLPLIESARHELVLRLPAEPVWLDVDTVRLSQVLSNLLSNAAKYTPQGGRITVSADADSGGMAVIQVLDTGIGIAPQALEAVFEMFAQAPQSVGISKGGLGIGLSLVRHLVALHGGSVTASSPGPGQGSTFTIRLPLAAGANAVAAAAAEQDGVPRRRDPLRILVADDNVDAADTLSILLRMEGHEVRVAYDGEQAIRIAEAFRPALAFLDIGMPRMDGYQTALALRALPGMHDIRLVALTGWGAEEERARTHAAGFDHHLLKPAFPEQVQAILAATPKVQAGAAVNRG